MTERTTCFVEGCPGDWRYTPPGRGHTCTIKDYLDAIGELAEAEE